MDEKKFPIFADELEIGYHVLQTFVANVKHGKGIAERQQDRAQARGVDYLLHMLI